MSLAVPVIVDVVVWGHDAAGLLHLAAGTILMFVHSSRHLNQGRVGTEGILHGVAVTSGLPQFQLPCVIDRDKIWSQKLIEQVQSFPVPSIGDTQVLLE